MVSPFIDNYEPLDVIGNGSSGIIRKVRRKTDGLIFACKEIKFERISERERKQIVAEVNILKGLHHDHIVRYHDRYTDRDAGILYILMEYCAGGDLSTTIKQATKQNLLLPEDTVWDYFFQILQALNHCHHPDGHVRPDSGISIDGGPDKEGGFRGVQILHRDLKPDNVLLSESKRVKLGDFGLSKVLAQTSLANTYVGTPYYMSPELIQERAYDSKSDIWSLGCLIYELCALKPPFHEAKTHPELSILIRNGRIPPLPRIYSQALTSIIMSMLNPNPTMRPSAAQLLQHERLEPFNRLADAEKMFSVVKAHRVTSSEKEREVLAREQTLIQNEQRVTSLFRQKDREIASLQQLVLQLQQQQQEKQFSTHDVEVAVKQAVARREEELRALVLKREEEIAVAIAKREEEFMKAVRNREAEIHAACVEREELIKKEVDARIQWVLARENQLKSEETKLQEMMRVGEESSKKVQQHSVGRAVTGQKEKNLLEEVELELSSSTMQVTPAPQQRRWKFEAQPPPRPTPSTDHTTSMDISVSCPTQIDHMSSAMKSILLTSVGEILATPSPAEFFNPLSCSLKVGLNFIKTSDSEEADSREGAQQRPENEAAIPPHSPSRKEKKANDKDTDNDYAPSGSSRSSSAVSAANLQKRQATAVPPPTSEDSSIFDTFFPLSAEPTSDDTASTSTVHTQPKPLPDPHLRPSTSSGSNLVADARSMTSLVPIPRSNPLSESDFGHEGRLPSPKRVDKAVAVKVAAAGAATTSLTSGHSNGHPTSGVSSGFNGSKGPKSTSWSDSSSSNFEVKSSGLLLRAVVAVNNASRKGTPSTSASTFVALQTATGNEVENEGKMVTSSLSVDKVDSAVARPSLASARKACEEARKALLRT